MPTEFDPARLLLRGPANEPLAPGGEVLVRHQAYGAIEQCSMTWGTQRKGFLVLALSPNEIRRALPWQVHTGLMPIRGWEEPVGIVELPTTSLLQVLWGTSADERWCVPVVRRRTPQILDELEARLWLAHDLYGDL